MWIRLTGNGSCWLLARKKSGRAEVSPANRTQIQLTGSDQNGKVFSWNQFEGNLKMGNAGCCAQYPACSDTVMLIYCSCFPIEGFFSRYFLQNFKNFQVHLSCLGGDDQLARNSQEIFTAVILTHSKYQPWGHKHPIGKQRSITIGCPPSLLASTLGH
jgi:hypothetical protein